MRTRVITATVASAALFATFPAAAMAALGGNQSNGQQHRKAAVQKRSADCTRSTSAGTLSTADVTTLQAMAEEEKLAHDVYVALNGTYGGVVFARIANSESRHLAALRKLMARYGVADPTAGLSEGEFATPATQQLYQDLLAQATTLQKALDVGATIERQDIADLRDAIAAADQRNVTRVYSNLLRGSQRHLVAFTR